MAFTNQPFQLSLFFALLIIVLGLQETPTLARPLNHHTTLSIRERHELWMAKHGRVYTDSVEKEKRCNIFKENVERIENFNNNASTKLYKLGVNAFADLTPEEFLASHTGYKKQFDSNSKSSYDSSTNPSGEFRYESFIGDVPDSLDWRKKGAVTSVKDQGNCGSCWAFSAVAAIEGLHQIKSKKLVSLSEQELIDCVKDSEGCNGGEMKLAYSFLAKRHKGLLTEEEYPYEAANGQCKVKSSGGRGGNDTGVTIDNFKSIPENDEDAILQAVVQQPVSVGIDANDLQLYQGGIYNGNCKQNLNHGVTIAGYGTDNGTKYWLVKNSWGESWGEKGYFRIIRGKNQCGIALDASYPI